MTKSAGPPWPLCREGADGVSDRQVSFFSDFISKFMSCTSRSENKMYSFLTTVGVVPVLVSKGVFFFILEFKNHAK